MKYETPTAEIVLFDAADIITSSGEQTVNRYDPFEADKF